MIEKSQGSKHVFMVVIRTKWYIRWFFYTYYCNEMFESRLHLYIWH